MQRSKVVSGVKLEEQLLDMTRTLPGHCFHREEKLRIFHSDIESLLVNSTFLTDSSVIFLLSEREFFFIKIGYV